MYTIGAIQIDIIFTFNSIMKNSVKCQLSRVLSDVHAACHNAAVTTETRLRFDGRAIPSVLWESRVHESRAIVDSQSRCRLAVVITA